MNYACSYLRTSVTMSIATLSVITLGFSSFGLHMQYVKMHLYMSACDNRKYILSIATYEAIHTASL